MAKTSPIPVRLSDELIARLDAAAAHAHLSNRTEVIKLCITSFLEYFEEHGSAALPLEWETMLRDLDGRRVKTPTLSMVAENSASYGSKASSAKLTAADSKKGRLGRGKIEGTDA